MAHFLIVEARFYIDLADELAAGAIEVLEAEGHTFERASVPGALEIPGAMMIGYRNPKAYDGYIALGVVIRGETSHYELVAGESARALMDLTLDPGLAIGNGIQTVENSDQAWARANRSDKNKGAGAARAAMALVALRQSLGTQ
ncbi:MAG: 6,7-dimethyl-8-ribityllumazine synthase [Cohaesibacteraceae bacterium]